MATNLLLAMLVSITVVISTNTQPQSNENYIFVEQTKTYDEAKQYCQQTYSTSLASIHTEIDNNEAISLCLNSTTDCWIGLNDIITEGVYQWVDGTTLDYGSDISGGIYPWSTISNPAPDNEYGIEDCILIDGPNGGVWNDYTCTYRAYFLCNKPSQLCNQQNWDVLYGDLLWSSDNTQNCEINSNQDSMSIINNQQWIHGNTSRGEQYWYFILMEYQFTINSLTGNTGECGVVLYHYETICDYIFIGIKMKTDGTYVFIDKYVNDTKMKIYEASSPLSFTYEYGQYYILKITVAYQSFLTWLISFGTTGYSIAGGKIQDQYPWNSLPTFIGLKNVNTSITAKSFYITDANNFDFDDAFCWETCKSNKTCSTSTMSPVTRTTNEVTTVETGNPTKSPTKNPTKIPTSDPLPDTNAAMIHMISLTYILSVLLCTFFSS